MGQPRVVCMPSRLYSVLEGLGDSLVDQRWLGPKMARPERILHQLFSHWSLAPVVMAARTRASVQRGLAMLLFAAAADAYSAGADALAANHASALQLDPEALLKLPARPPSAPPLVGCERLSTREDLGARDPPERCRDVPIGIVGGCSAYFQPTEEDVGDHAGGLQMCFSEGAQLEAALMEASRLMRAYFASFDAVSDALATIDTDGNGGASSAELVAAAEQIDSDLLRERMYEGSRWLVSALLDDFDASGDGELQLDEFTRLASTTSTSNSTHLGFDSMLRRLSKCSAEPTGVCAAHQAAAMRCDAMRCDAAA